MKSPLPASPPVAGANRNGVWLRQGLGTGLFYYAVTSAVAVLGLLFGHSFLERQWYRRTKPDTIIDAFTGWDGYWYK